MRKSKKIKWTTLDNVEDIAIETNNNLDEDIMYLYQAINKLSKIDRAITMLFLEECSYEDMGEILGISSANVGVRINRIKKKLKTILSNN